jgi:hypothetical protein
MESSKPHNIKSKDQISSSAISESLHNKKDSLDTFFLNGTDLTNTKQFAETVQSSSIGNNIEIKTEEAFGNISIKKENEEKIDEIDSTKPKEFCNHDVNIMDSVRKEQTTPVINSSSVQILGELKTTEDQFVTQMEEDAFYLDDGHRDANSDADRIGTLLNKDRTGTFRILSPAKAVDFSVWNLDEKSNNDILVVNNTEIRLNKV